VERYLSDEYLDDIIASAVENYAAPVHAIPPHFPSAPLPLNEAVYRLEDTIGGWCRDALGWSDAVAAQQLGLRATAGLGKSRKLLQILVRNLDADNGKIEIYVPRHRLADELASELDIIIGDVLLDSRRRIRAQIIRGREHVGQSGTAMCAKADIAAELARAGHEVWGHLCERRQKDGNVERCEHYHS